MRGRQGRFRDAAAMALVLGLVAVAIVGCEDETESTPPGLEAGPPTACVSIPADRCERAVAAVNERHGRLAPVSHVEVHGALCAGPCPEDEAAAWRAIVAVEFSDGRPPETATLQVTGAEAAWQRMQIPWGRVEPASAPMPARELRIQLGHCGLSSGIDVDGSFWDPVGPIDGADETLINASNATFRLVGPNHGTLQVHDGPIVQLVRHVGPKHLLACD